MVGNKTIDTAAKWLIVIGAVNWGLAGVGGLVKANLNVINIALGKIAVVESIVYVLVGLAGLYTLIGMFKK